MRKIARSPSDNQNDQEGHMRKTLRALMAVLSVLVAVMAIVLFVYRLGEARTSGERSSGAEYSILRNALLTAQSSQDFQDQFLRDRLIALYKGSDRLLAAQVLDASGFAVWKLPSGSAYFALPNDTSMRIGYAAPEWSTVIFTTPLSGGMKLSALYATVHRSDISWAARLPLIVAALWCLLVALVIVLFGRNRKESILPETFKAAGVEAGNENPPPETESVSDMSEAAAKEPEATAPEDLAANDLVEDYGIDEEEENPPAPEAAQEAPVPPSNVLQPVAEAAGPGRNFEESLAKLEEEIMEWSSRHPEQASNPPKAELAGTEAEEVVTPAAPSQDELDEELSEELEEIDAAPEEEAERSADTDLADSRETLQEFEELNAEALGEQREVPAEIPSTPKVDPVATPNARPDIANFPMPLALTDQQLDARLGEELNRNTKTDVSLMLIHCSVSSRTDPAAVALAVTIKDYVGSKDLFFELYKGAFAIVLPSVDLGGALKMSEDLADVLSATMSLYRDIEGEAPVFIGISARGNRQIDAYKIYREASTAVHKAYSGGHSRILAFRPKAD